MPMRRIPRNLRGSLKQFEQGFSLYFFNKEKMCMLFVYGILKVQGGGFQKCRSIS